MGSGIGRKMRHRRRKRSHDPESKQPRVSSLSAGERQPDRGMTPPETFHRPPNNDVPARNRAFMNGRDPLRDLARKHEDIRAKDIGAGARLHASASPLDELTQRIDRSGHGAADGGTAPFQHRWTAAPDRVLRESSDATPSARDELSALLSKRGIADPGYDRRVGDAIDESISRATAGPWPAGLAAIFSTPATDVPRGASYPDRGSDDADDLLRRGFEYHANACRSADPLSAITRQLDDLAHEMTQREHGATEAEIAAFKDRLAALARETELQAERKLLDGDGGTHRPPGPMSCATGLYGGSDGIQDDAGEHAPGSGPRGHGGWEMLDGAQQRFDAVAARANQTRWQPIESELSVILDSMALHRRPDSPNSGPEVILCGAGEAVSSKGDELVAVVSERWFGNPPRGRERATTAGGGSTMTGVDPAQPSTLPVRVEGASRKRPSRSTVAPIVRAALAAVLALGAVVTGAHFARSRMSEAPTAGAIAALVHKPAPAGEAIASGPLTIMPANSVARFQDLVFQLPQLYGIYAINSGRLFELEALPGQAPDPRIAVSAVIPRPSHTTLPDGRVAFLLFRRDVATSISERVSVRVVARIKRPTSGPETGPRDAGVENAWTIRNIAVDFRVAPVEHNREMVLLLSETSDFTFPAGRYALILKGQAYDFTVAGPITDPSQCLERIEAANGSFFHQCQAPEPGAAEISAQEPALVSPGSASKFRRQGEKHARQ